ncbi:1-phosphofructokinase [Rathayibacter sp. AY1B1]|uniref:1-phosphofructokinase family hexose kinase n=1 Tax=unclassified Rathayibacter TaxID=2609250 RepID=UPI000CE737B5|nr:MULTISPECIES: 1-phosphofructokinase family hexose kinase [unclassified Rathayibacter]PPI25629.1 1-phosphofructokinase [Rathayibacter sp. AY1B6]PPI32337.1 1-phosphofructokinase [Rathayibacter sp. AY1B1]
MIVTVTANPSIDVTLSTSGFAVGEVNRAHDVRRDPAGKGVNVARALARNGVEATAVYPADASTGLDLSTMLRAAGVRSASAAIAHPIRTNITVVDDRTGRTTKINEPGPAVTEEEARALSELIGEHVSASPRWLVACGSVPPGLGADFYPALGRLALHFGVPLAVDTSGAPLTAIIAAGTATLVKPNLEELEELLGRSLTTVGDVVAGARELLQLPDARALVSLGEHGALLVTAHASWWAGAPAVVPLSTVGAGDSTLAGYLSAVDATEAERLATAVAWGTAAVQLPGSEAPGPDSLHLDDVSVVEDPDPTLPIGELSA